MINSHLVIIHKKPILFNILNEIKSNLNFKIILVDDDNIDIKNKLENFVIISDSEKLYSKGVLKIENYPINIQKLVEIINIQFLKNKFQQQNNIKVGKYEINLNSRKMSYKEITVQNLQSEVWGYKSKLETHTVETHVYRLRKKVEKKFNDKAFILSLKNGYKI